MQLLFPIPYPETEEDDYEFTAALRGLSLELPGDTVAFEGNAGLGADWPVGVVRSAKAIAIAYAVFSAPATIKENWPLWIEIFQQVKSITEDKFGEIIIDRDSAQMIAMYHCVDVMGLGVDSLEMHMAIRHYFLNGCGSYDDLLKAERVDLEWPASQQYGDESYQKAVKSTAEAARQAGARYCFGISDRGDTVTIIVESNGSISLAKKI